jgi:hypothetical protein
MLELYEQNCGKKRIVNVVGWNRKNAIVKDLRSELTYTISWDLFFKHCTKLEPFECDVSKYDGPNLEIK